MSFTKVHQSILQSSLWCEDSDTKVVWITLLALADRHGEVMASVPGLARTAGVTLEKCQAAIAKFTQPDPHSRTPDLEGRRLEPIPGGWALVNHAKYRHEASKEDSKEKAAQRQKRHRETKQALRVTPSNGQSVTVTPSNAPVTQSRDIAETEAEADAEADSKKDKGKEVEASLPFSLSPKPSKKPAGEHRQMIDAWRQAYEEAHGTKFVVTPRDAKAAKDLLASGVKPDDVASLAKAAWANKGKDSWNCQNRTATLYDFADAFMKIKQEVSKAGGTSSAPIGGEFCEGWWNKDPKHMTSKEISAYVDR